MSTIYVNAHSFAALDLESEIFYGAQSPLNHKLSLLDLRSGSEPFSENLRRLLSITFVHGLAAGMVGGGWTSINESFALHFKTDTTSILDARFPLLSRQPKLKTRCRFSSSIPTALCLTLTCLTNLPEPSCSLQTKIASHDGSELSPQILAAVHNNESLLSLSFSDFIDQRLDFGSGKSLWLQHGNVGSESICMDSLPTLLESIEKLILMSVDVKVKRSVLPNLYHSCLHTIVLGAHHTCFMSSCFTLSMSVRPACVCGIQHLAWRHKLKHPRVIDSEVHMFLLGAIFGIVPNVSSVTHHQRPTPTTASTTSILLLLCWNLSKLEDCSPLAFSTLRKASQTSSCKGHERSFSTFLRFAGVTTSIKVFLHEKDPCLGCIANDHCRFPYRLIPCVMVCLGPEGTTILTPVRIEVVERSTSRYTVTISVEEFKGRCNLSRGFLVTTASGVVLGFLVGLLCVYLTMPQSDYSFLKLPRNLQDLQILRDNLEIYTSDYTVQVLVGYCLVYVFMQTFMIPGTVFMSLLAGALFGVIKGMALVVSTATAGASSCFFLSKLIGRPLIFSLWPDKLIFFQDQVARRKDGLLNYMLFLRLTPTLPNTFINVASPIVDVPYHIFFLATFIGLIPAAYVTVRAGIALGELKSLGDLYDFSSMATLFLIGVLSVTPTLISKKKV
ncbi:hypothetical protein F2Q70_00034496 [Brassica cretica]|uniref:VTT domain-containing protein n=2 Tax=Brassica cretica TaxID=69181 RepID=A0A8S9JZ40_BRACR|nr:hypothetical protein F2Q70_00034496 [Brassica cretica]